MTQTRLERIENGVSDGTPDVHGIARGVTTWFELKVLKRPKRLTTPLFKKKTLRPAQTAWHLNYAWHGGRSYVLVRDTAKQLYLIPGGEVRGIELRSLEDMQQYAVRDWTEVYMKSFRAY